MSSGDLIDCHVHLVVPGGDPQRGFVSETMRRSVVFRLVQRHRGLSKATPDELAQAYLDELTRDLAASRDVRAVVLLALDGVYDHCGDLDVASSHMYIANDAVLDLADADPAILAGASVNPRRRDWRAELGRVAERGAVLIKWLPNAQQFDPGAADLAPFYEELVRLRLPLLVHSGVELSVASSSFHRGGDPERWRLALDIGVDVIAAHAGSSGRFGVGRYGRSFLEMLDAYPNLYADSSALALPSRVAMLRALVRRPDTLARLTFGTDFPLPSIAPLLLLYGRPRAYFATRAVTNHFDRQVAFFRGFGWEPSSAVLERLIGG